MIPILVLLQISHSTDIDNPYPLHTLSVLNPIPALLKVAFLRLDTLTDALIANKHFDGVYWWVTLRGKMKCQNIQSVNISPYFKVFSLIPYQSKKGYLAMFIIFANWYS